MPILVTVTTTYQDPGDDAQAGTQNALAGKLTAINISTNTRTVPAPAVSQQRTTTVTHTSTAPAVQAAPDPAAANTPA